MFPMAPLFGTSALPLGAVFRMPKTSDMSEDGFGCFQNTWLIKNVRAREAREILEEERTIASLVDRLSSDAQRFEVISSIAEFGGIDDPALDISESERTALREVVSDVPPELGGLELGVAGLAHALASVGILPAASCRSHYPANRSWSDAPVVFFAATYFRAHALQPLAEASGCTFLIDQSRPELLVVRGPSIVEMMALACAILDSRSRFARPRSSPARRPKRRPEASIQDPLF